jgi:hypothetical protein
LCLGPSLAFTRRGGPLFVEHTVHPLPVPRNLPIRRVIVRVSPQGPCHGDSPLIGNRSVEQVLRTDLAVRRCGISALRTVTVLNRSVAVSGSNRNRAFGPSPSRTAPKRSALAYTQSREHLNRRATSAASISSPPAASPRSISATRRATASTEAPSRWTVALMTCPRTSQRFARPARPGRRGRRSGRSSLDLHPRLHGLP